MNLSLRFEPNRGQFDGRVRYGARGQGYGLYLTNEGATLALRRPNPGSKPSTVAGSQAPDVGGSGEQEVVTMHVVGGRGVEPSATELQAGTSNYFNGNDPSKWHAGIEGYARVHYAGVLPGVDLVFYGADQKRLEYDLVLAPGADPAKVALSFEGVAKVAVNPEGDAVLSFAGGGEIRQARPVAYQIDDAGMRTVVDSRYELRQGKALGFIVGNRDLHRPLVIDPTLQYSSFLGGRSDDGARGIAVDSAGNVYVTGVTYSNNLPKTVGAGFNGVSDTFVAKFNPSSASYVYLTYLGGSDLDEGLGIAVDGAGCAYVAGLTESNNFPIKGSVPGQGALQGLSDAFVTKLNADGTLGYSTYLGGQSWDMALAITLDSANNAYLTGYTTSGNSFPNPTAPRLPTPLPGQTLDGSDAFVAEIDSTGASIVFSSLLGGSDEDTGRAIAIDVSGKVYVAGYTRSADFPLLAPLTGQSTLLGLGDAFVTSIDLNPQNPSNPQFSYSTLLGGTGDDGARGIAVDVVGSMFVTGYTASAQGFPSAVGVPGRQGVYGGGGCDAFVAKISPGGSAGLVYFTYLGGAGVDIASGIAVDREGDAYVSGSTYSADFPTHLVPPIAGQNLANYQGGIDAFASVLNPAGTALVYSTYLGSADPWATEYSYAIAVDAIKNTDYGNAYVAGSTESEAFPVASALQGTYGGGATEAFVSMIAPAPGDFPSCTPTTCAAKGATCGTIADGCGGTLICGPACTYYYLSGSDTMTQIIEAAIARSGANLKYLNVGSGQGEKNILKQPGYTDAQSIAPMSRDFDQCYDLGDISPPTPDNVVCLDAGVVAVGNIPPHITDLTCSAKPGNNACDQTCDITVNPLAIALGGYPASCRASGTWSASAATTAECADPKRMAALSFLNTKQGFHIDHFLRRDDISGTQELFREKLQFSRWCNGQSEGSRATPGSNLLNWDLDPVRKPCMNSGGVVQDTRCTYYPLNYPPVGQTCQNGQTLAANDPNNPYGVAIPCTQGWVVALSETDTGAHMPDITTSIGGRINTALDGSIMGGAGLPILGNPGDPTPTPPIPAVNLPNTVGITLNTQGYDEDTVRGGHYAMWRRLFLMNRNPPDLVNDPTGAIRMADCVAWTGDAGRCTEEQKLYDWAVIRKNMCNICVYAGFYDPIPGCNVPVTGCGDPLNETCLQATPGSCPPKMNTGAEAPGTAKHGATCDTAYPCVANGQIASAAGGDCGGTETGKCPVIPVEGVGYACNLDSKCSGGTATCNTSAIIEVCR